MNILQPLQQTSTSLAQQSTSHLGWSAVKYRDDMILFSFFIFHLLPYTYNVLYTSNARFCWYSLRASLYPICVLSEALRSSLRSTRQTRGRLTGQSIVGTCKHRKTGNVESKHMLTII